MPVIMRPSAFVSQILNKSRMGWIVDGSAKFTVLHKKGDEILFTASAQALASYFYGFTTQYGLKPNKDYVFRCKAILTGLSNSQYDQYEIAYYVDANNRHGAGYYSNNASPYRVQHHILKIATNKIAVDANVTLADKRQFKITRSTDTYHGYDAADLFSALSEIGTGGTSTGLATTGKLAFYLADTGTPYNSSCRFFGAQLNA